jgi:hypothetical protein
VIAWGLGLVVVILIVASELKRQRLAKAVAALYRRDRGDHDGR